MSPAHLSRYSFYKACSFTGEIDLVTRRRLVTRLVVIFTSYVLVTSL